MFASQVSGQNNLLFGLYRKYSNRHTLPMKVYRVLARLVRKYSLAAHKTFIKLWTTKLLSIHRCWWTFTKSGRLLRWDLSFYTQPLETPTKPLAVIQVHLAENWRLPGSELQEDETVKSPRSLVSFTSTPFVQFLQSLANFAQLIQGAVAIYPPLGTIRVDTLALRFYIISRSMQQVGPVRSVTPTKI